MDNGQPVGHLEMLRVLVLSAFQNLKGLVKVAGLEKLPGHLQGIFRIIP